MSQNLLEEEVGEGNGTCWVCHFKPEVVVTDGGSGFAKAVRETWPRTRVQRCTFHAFSQVKRYTTTRPKLQAGRELYLIARDLIDRKSTRLNSSHIQKSRMPSSA